MNTILNHTWQYLFPLVQIILCHQFINYHSLTNISLQIRSQIVICKNMKLQLCKNNGTLSAINYPSLKAGFVSHIFSNDKLSCKSRFCGILRTSHIIFVHFLFLYLEWHDILWWWPKWQIKRVSRLSEWKTLLQRQMFIALYCPWKANQKSQCLLKNNVLE